MVVPMTMTIKREAEKHESVPFEIEIRKRGHEERWRVLLYAQARRHVRTRKGKTHRHNEGPLVEISLFRPQEMLETFNFQSFQMVYDSKNDQLAILWQMTHP